MKTRAANQEILNGTRGGAELTILRRVPILTGLSESALQLIHERSDQEEYATGEVVVREGQSNNRIYIISSGSVRVCKNLGAPNEIELARLSNGEFFGEMCILDCLPRSASVQALTNITLTSFSSMVFWKLHQSDPGDYGLVILNIARDLSRRLRQLDERFAAAHHI